MRRWVLVATLGAAACAGASAPGGGSLPLDAIGGAVDPRMGLWRDPAIVSAIADVSPERIRATDSALVAFGTRNTLSDTLSATRGIGAARRWLHGRLVEIGTGCGGCLRVEYDAAVVPVPRHADGASVNVVNVLGVLRGRDTMRVVVMGAHYDSCVCSASPTAVHDADGDAPGADDDGSGTSAVVELARVLSRRYPRGLEATVMFALYAGEEQGLLGSANLAARLQREGKSVVAAMTDDIVGNVVAEDGRVDSTSVRIFAADPDSSGSRELGRLVWGLGALYLPETNVVPVWRADRIQRSGDHIPFVRAGWPGLRFTERLENYRRQHLPTDDLAHVNFGYVARVARLNAASIVALASAPSAPDAVVARREARVTGGRSWVLDWRPVGGARSYEVLVRRTTSPTWERVLPAGSDTSATVAFQLDDGWAGVRAVGAGGHRSLARAARVAEALRPVSTR